MIVQDSRDPVRALRFAPPLLAALLLAACGGGGAPPQMPPSEVNVATVVSKRVAQWDEFTGRIEAVESVEIRPRVAGYIAGVHFEDGAEVERGQLLFTIDDREYRAAADSAQAGVARAATRVDVARTELARTEKLAAVRAASTEELEQRRGELRQAEADLKATEAQARQAALNLGFTRITSPIDGRVSLARLRVGNLVGAGDPVLTTVVSLDPVYVTFRGDERAYLRYQGMARDGSRPSSRDVENPVRVALADDTGFPHEGRVVFVDNAVDPATGTILARAELPNAEGRFTPGLFARVQLLGSGERDALLVHPQAVLADQDRRYVYVAAPVTSPQGGPQYTGAVRKDVVLGPVVDGLVVVEQGLAPSDKVVVNGMRKIFFPGAPLAPVDVPMDAPNTIVAAPAAATPGGAPAQAADGAKG
jgi:multidrug efflux system membrane fusion protein